MKKFRALIAIFYEHRLLYLSSVIAISLATFFAYTIPLVIRTTIDSLLNNIPLDPSNFVDKVFIFFGGAEILRDRLYAPALILLVIVGCQGAFTFLSRSMVARAAEKSIEKLRNDIFSHIQRQSFSYFGNSATGDLIQRCTSDVETIRRFVETQFVEIGNTIIMLFIALSLMFSIHEPLAWLTVPIIPLTVCFSFFFFLKVQKAFTLSDEREGRLSEMLSEHLRSIRVVKAFGREEHEIKRCDSLNMDCRTAAQELSDLLATYWGITSFFTIFQTVLVLGMGSLWAAQGSVTLGTLQVFLAYVWMILWPLRQMGRVLVDMGKALVAVERINDIFAQVPEDIRPDGAHHELQGRISFRNISFSYPSPHLPKGAKELSEGGNVATKVLNNLSFDINPGETIGILGPTGSGKTSILHLLAGLYPEYEGDIFLDGKELRTLNLLEYRRQLGYVLQEPLLFSGSIKKNILMGWGNALLADVERAAKNAEIHHAIQDFDRHYYTIVGEWGVTLSGGQKQRVAIARTIIRNLPVYMFDDSLSALDAETDAKIRNNLIERGKKSTVLIVSHRLSTVAGADRIIVLEHGSVSQMGSHAELSRQEGLYKRLWELQQRNASSSTEGSENEEK